MVTLPRYIAEAVRSALLLWCLLLVAVGDVVDSILVSASSCGLRCVRVIFIQVPRDLDVNQLDTVCGGVLSVSVVSGRLPLVAGSCGVLVAVSLLWPLFARGGDIVNCCLCVFLFVVRFVLCWCSSEPKCRP